MNWQDIEEAPLCTYVLVARKSGYTGTKWEFMTALWDPEYKGWTDVSNDRLADSGENPLFWAPLPKPPEEGQ